MVHLYATKYVFLENTHEKDPFFSSSVWLYNTLQLNYYSSSPGNSIIMFKAYFISQIIFSSYMYWKEGLLKIFLHLFAKVSCLSHMELLQMPRSF